ncbi:MAG: glycine cleavage system protein GcvH [Acidimicrobiales bacterium]
MELPKELKYTADHEWVKLDGGRVWVGITDYAQDALGDIVFVGLPKVGDTCSVGSSIAEVESTKSVSDIYAPVSGEVVSVNEALLENPEILNSDPYDGGWICEISVTDLSAVDALLDSDAYQALIA